MDTLPRSDFPRKMNFAWQCDESGSNYLLSIIRKTMKTLLYCIFVIFPCLMWYYDLIHYLINIK